MPVREQRKTTRRSWLIAAAILLAGAAISVLILLRPSSSGAVAEGKVRDADDGTRYSVRFYAEDGTLLDEKTVRRGDSVLPPTADVAGTVFKGWSQSLSGISSDTDVWAQYAVPEPETQNVVYGGAVYADCHAPILVPIRLGGSVDCCGFAIEIGYDAALLTFEEAEQPLSGVTVENDAKRGVLTLRYGGGTLSEPVQLAALRFSCRESGGWRTVLPVETHEIVTRRGGETVYTDSVAYDIELHLLEP